MGVGHDTDAESFRQHQNDPARAGRRRGRRHRRARRRRCLGPALSGDTAGPHQRARGLARLRPARHGRAVRPERLRLQPAARARPQRCEQRDCDRDDRQAGTLRLRFGSRRGRGCLEDQEAERSGADLSPRRGLAERPLGGLRALCRALHQCRCAFCLGRFHQCARDQGGSVPAGRSMPARGGVDLPQCGELRRRSGAALPLQPLVRQPSRRLRGRRWGYRAPPSRAR